MIQRMFGLVGAPAPQEDRLAAVTASPVLRKNVRRSWVGALLTMDLLSGFALQLF